MVGTIDIRCNAQHPEMALPTLYTFKNSASFLKLLDVPKKIGAWEIQSVQLKAIYPNNLVVETECKSVGGIWYGTLNGTDITGISKSGFGITATCSDGKSYILGIGDIVVLECDNQLIPDPSPECGFYIVKLFNEQPEILKTGYMWVENDSLHLKTLSGEITIGQGKDFSNEISALSADVYQLSDDIDLINTEYLRTITSDVASLADAVELNFNNISALSANLTHFSSQVSSELTAIQDEQDAMRTNQEVVVDRLYYLQDDVNYVIELINEFTPRLQRVEGQIVDIDRRVTALENR